MRFGVTSRTRRLWLLSVVGRRRVLHRQVGHGVGHRRHVDQGGVYRASIGDLRTRRWFGHNYSLTIRRGKNWSRRSNLSVQAMVPSRAGPYHAGRRRSHVVVVSLLGRRSHHAVEVPREEGGGGDGEVRLVERGRRRGTEVAAVVGVATTVVHHVLGNPRGAVAVVEAVRGAGATVAVVHHSVPALHGVAGSDQG